jgi:hypothetical protein
MRFPRKKKTTQEKIEALFQKNAKLQLKQASFERQYHNEAVRLEKKRNSGAEYTR